MEETTLSGETTNSTPPEEQERPNPQRAHWEWKERIRDTARIGYPESWIFEEYNEDCNCYTFYYHDLDGEIEGIMLREKDIKRINLFLQKSKSEEKYRKHILDN